VPKGFKLPIDRQKYDGLQEPEAWPDDYLRTIKVQGGTKATAMQSLQLYLSGPASIEELRACVQKASEPVRAYLQRWSITKKSAENISDERAIDAFNNGLRRKDFVEELGRVRLKTISELMDLANKWANGEDAVSNKRARSPEEERYRRNNDSKRRGSRNYEDYDKPNQVAAGFTSRDDRKDEYRSGGYRSSNREEPSSSRQIYRPRPRI
jgi:hypothetical protein